MSASVQEAAGIFLSWFEGFIGKQAMAEINCHCAEYLALRGALNAANRADKRRAVSCLAQFPEVQKIIADAAKLKDARVRDQVQEMIRCGLENADDTCSVSFYARECTRFPSFATDYPTREAYWRSMFYSSAQSCTCDAPQIIGCPLDGRAKNWLLKRGLLG